MRVCTISDLTTTTTEKEPKMTDEIDTARRRLHGILTNTPQFYGFNTRPTQTLDEILETVERVMTGDYRQALNQLAEAEAQVAKLTAERDTVRAFFGVS